MKSFEKIDLEGNNLMDNDLPKTFSTFNTFSDFDFSSMMRGQIMAQAVTQLWQLLLVDFSNFMVIEKVRRPYFENGRGFSIIRTNVPLTQLGFTYFFHVRKTEKEQFPFRFDLHFPKKMNAQLQGFFRHSHYAFSDFISHMYMYIQHTVFLFNSFTCNHIIYRFYGYHQMLLFQTLFLLMLECTNQCH